MEGLLGLLRRRLSVLGLNPLIVLREVKAADSSAEGNGEGSFEKVDKSVKKHGTVAGLKFTAGGCVLDDSAVESVRMR